RLDRLDPAQLRPGRFDQVVELPLPDAASRRQIYSVHLADKPLAFEPDLYGFAEESRGFSGADIAECCRVAALEALGRAIESGAAPTIEARDLERAIADRSAGACP
ncbi:MAG: AAA family ATPase, partial [Acidobacteriota bacterium]